MTDEPRCRLCGRTEQEAKTAFDEEGVCEDWFGCLREQNKNLKAEKDMLIAYILEELSPEDMVTIGTAVEAAKMMKEMGETLNSDTRNGSESNH